MRDVLIASFLACAGLLVAVTVFPHPAAVSAEGWVAMGLAVFVFYLFADHLAHALADYAEHRGPRRLRGVMIGLLLAAGTLGIFMGTIARYVPELADIARFVRWVTIGMLFVGGITTWVTWRWPGSEHD